MALGEDENGRNWEAAGKARGLPGSPETHDFRPHHRGVGGVLRANRERAGLDLDAVAATLRIRRPHLAAIEEGRVDDLPGLPYALGFVRSYADYLGLDVEECLRQFKEEAGGVEKPQLVFPVPLSESRIPGGALVAISCVLAIIIYAGWYYLSGSSSAQTQLLTPPPETRLSLVQPDAPGTAPARPGTPAAVSPPGTPAAQAAPAPVATQAQAASPPPAGTPAVRSSAGPAQAAEYPPPPGSLRAGGVQVAALNGERAEPQVVIRATEDSWIQVRNDAGQKVLVGRLLRAGETQVLAARGDLRLTTGNAGGLEIRVNGQAVPPLGASGVVIRNIPLDGERLLAGTATNN